MPLPARTESDRAGRRSSAPSLAHEALLRDWRPVGARNSAVEHSTIFFSYSGGCRAFRVSVDSRMI